MKFLRKQFDNVEPLFHKGGKLEKYYALYEAADTFLFTPNSVAKGNTHLRDGLDLKRMMITVAVALTPCMIMAMYNTGHQANLAIESMGGTADGWRAAVINFLGLGFSPSSLIANMVHGALWFMPVFLVTNIAGGLVEGAFAMARNHEINEGFMITGMLFPLTLPPTIPLWQVALAIVFGVVFGKEVFGGTGKNFLNVAILARAFLYFAYPAEISGDAVWVAADGFTAATPLAQVAASGPSAITVNWFQAFLGNMPGSMGETSVLASLIGCAYLIYSGIGSWRTIISCVAGLVLTVLLFNFIGSDSNPAMALSPAWHLVIGGFAFGTVFMATDPVSSAQTEKGRYIYGFIIGVMTALVRVVNPAFPEGIMLAILFGNCFAPLIDWFVVDANVKRRRAKANG